MTLTHCAPWEEEAGLEFGESNTNAKHVGQEHRLTHKSLWAIWMDGRSARRQSTCTSSLLSVLELWFKGSQVKGTWRATSAFPLSPVFTIFGPQQASSGPSLAQASEALDLAFILRGNVSSYSSYPLGLPLTWGGRGLYISGSLWRLNLRSGWNGWPFYLWSSQEDMLIP